MYYFYQIFFVPFILLFMIFGAYKLWLLYLYKKSRDKKIKYEELDFYPFVTIQIPVYNEYNVIERCIKSAVSLDYPKDKFEIHILDDSDDETKYLIDSIVEEKKKEGFNIEVIRRDKREGFKAGALKNGLKYANGEFIAIFDADFIIPPNFLKKTLPFFKNKDVALVQTRWGFINDEESRLTKIQKLSLNTHFEIEHNSKFKNGYFFNFNGTAGIWRKEAIVTSGNWQCDTLAEDLDLSVRAYLRGWKFVFLNDLICPSELPSDFNSFITQQFRWTKGTFEVGLKLFKDVINSRIKFEDKLNIIFHLFSPILYFANLFFFFILWPLSHFSPILFGLCAVFFGMSNLYNIFLTDKIISKNRSLKERIFDLFYLIIIFTGFCFKGTIAVLEAIFKRKTPFERTPKKGDRKKNYTISPKRHMEIMGAIYYIFLIPFILKFELYGFLPWAILFSLSSLYFFYLSTKELKF